MADITLREKAFLATWYFADRFKSTIRNLKLSDPKAWNPLLWNLYGQSQTESGINVTEETGINLSSVYAAINIIAGTIATLPIHLYKKQSSGKRKIISDHPSLQRLKYRANDVMPAINFREATTAHVLAWGNMYAEIVRNAVGDIVELWPITPDRVLPEWKGGTIQYRIDVNGNYVYLPRNQVLHIAGLGYDGLVGYSVVRKAAESIGLAIAGEKFGARYFGSNTNIGGVIKYPRSLGPDQQKNIKRSLSDYTGSNHSHRWMILEQGMEIEKLGFSPDDSQFLQTRQFQVSEIARWFNLPPHKLKDLTRSTFSNIEEQEIEYVTGTIRPWLERIEQNYNIQLLTEKEQRLGYYFKHSVEGLLRGSSQARAEYYTKRFYLGSITPNEIRELEDDEPLDNEFADKAFVQMNVMPLDDIGKEPMPQNPQNISGDQPPKSEDPQQNALVWARDQIKLIAYRNVAARDKIAKRYHALIKDSAGVVVWREEQIIKKAIGTKNKNSVRQNPGNLKKDIEQIYSDFESYIESKMQPVFNAYADSVFNQSLLEIGESVEEIPDNIRLEFNRYTRVYAKRHVGSSLGQLNKIIEENEENHIDLINKRVGEWREKRSQKIADNETIRLGAFAAQTAFFAFGYRSYWRIRGADTCPYCQALNGKSIAIGQNFFNGGEEFEPKDAENGPMLIRSTVMHPPLHQGCDCYISAR